MNEKTSHVTVDDDLCDLTVNNRCLMTYTLDVQVCYTGFKSNYVVTTYTTTDMHVYASFIPIKQTTIPFVANEYIYIQLETYTLLCKKSN